FVTSRVFLQRPQTGFSVSRAWGTRFIVPQWRHRKTSFVAFTRATWSSATSSSIPCPARRNSPSGRGRKAVYGRGIAVVRGKRGGLAVGAERVERKGREHGRPPSQRTALPDPGVPGLP